MSPSLDGVLETALYVDDLNAAQRFYMDVLGLPLVFKVPGRQLVFACGQSILLVFNPERTEQEQITINDGAIPFHGARGPGHMAFRVDKTELAQWRKRLDAAGVSVESEITWPNGARSLYFRDPAGNSLEFATPDMWKSWKQAVE